MGVKAGKDASVVDNDDLITVIEGIIRVVKRDDARSVLMFDQLLDFPKDHVAILKV